MRFYKTIGANLCEFALNRLKIDSYCVLCNRSTSSARDVCAACESLLVGCNHTDRGGIRSCLCLNCGAVSASGDCADCEGRSSPFVRIVAPYRYAFPLDKMIQQLKYRDQRVYARVLGSLLSSEVGRDSELPDCLVPVPLSAGREKTRGFNQAADIARWCGAELGVPSWPWAAQRLIDTGSMAGLSRASRQHRIIGAFRADEAVFGRRVAIIDDVLTTGSTARELATELYDTGASSVELWVLARTSSER